MEIQYDKQGRMNYHPDFHPNQDKTLTTHELAYLCKFYEHDELIDLALALGRTEHGLRMKVVKLKKQGMYRMYKEMWDVIFEKHSGLIPESDKESVMM